MNQSLEVTKSTLRQQLFDREQVAEQLGISVATFDRMVKRGEAPPAIPISKRLKLWSPETIVEWLRKREGRAVS